MRDLTKNIKKKGKPSNENMKTSIKNRIFYKVR